MKRTVLNVQQGTPEWMAARAASDGTASEAAAAQGKGKYQTRTELLNQRKFGIAKDIDAATQALFNRGHESESTAREIAEEIICEELSPVTMMLEVDGMKLLASLDGINFDGTVIWEHKLWSESLAEQVRNESLEEHYTIQMDQELLVSGADKCLFMVSDGTRDKCEWMWYESSTNKASRIIVGWLQFHKDLAEHVLPEVAAKPKTEAVEAFPVPSIQVRGELVACNLEEITPYFDRFLTETKTKLETDDDFAQAEVNAKASREAAKNCKLTAKAVVDQIMPVSEVVRTLEGYSKKFDELGLLLEKAVKEQKDIIKSNAINAARREFHAHVDALEDEIKPIFLGIESPNFAEAIKGLKKLDSMHEAIGNALRSGKYDADVIAKDYRNKLAWCKENAAGMSMLFPDLQQIISKPMDDFTLLITSRIEAHKKAEAEKEAQIRADAESAAKAKAEAEVASATQNTQGEDAPTQAATTGDGGAAPLNPARTSEMKREAIVEHQDEISEFLKSRTFKDESRIRAILVEFVAFQTVRYQMVA